MKKKVNTLTFHGVLNHGAVLQAYALQKFLMKSGFDSELINYKPLYFIWQVFRPAKSIKKTVLKYKRLNKFKKFSKDHLHITKKFFFTEKDFKKLSSCDIVICGSDQIWNKDITGGSIDDVFFQRYTHKAKKIAYAASAGANILSSELGACKALSDFSAIGVREKHLVEDLSRMKSITDPILVVDPTLLLNKESYREICHSSIIPHGEYIVSYEVSSDETRGHYDSFISELKKILKLPVYHIGDKPIKSADKNILDISPSDWVSFFGSAKIVVTNSFHGTAFGVNFKKPLFVLSHCDHSRNVRIESFLDEIKMSDCLVQISTYINEDFVKKLLRDRDYYYFDKYVNASEEFLLESLR